MLTEAHRLWKIPVKWKKKSQTIKNNRSSNLKTKANFYFHNISLYFHYENIKFPRTIKSFHKTYNFIVFKLKNSCKLFGHTSWTQGERKSKTIPSEARNDNYIVMWQDTNHNHWMLSSRCLILENKQGNRYYSKVITTIRMRSEVIFNDAFKT